MMDYFTQVSFRRSTLILSFVLLFFASCKKEPTIPPNQEKAVAIQSNKIAPEKVDAVLLNTYINYQLKVEANSLLKKAGKIVELITPKMGRKEFDLMIANYLANERNMILSKTYAMKKSIVTSSTFNNGNGDPWPEIPIDNNLNPDNPFSGIGSFPGSTITSVLFAGRINSNGIISQSSFGFAGVHGTITPIGSLSQAVYNGVTTYQQNFQEVTTGSFGIVYTQLFVVYGNIYGSTITVTGMALPSP